MNDRIERVINGMKKMGLSQMIVSDPMSIWYLTGLNLDPGERLFAFYINDRGETVLFINILFKAHGTAFREVWFSDTDDQISLLADVIDPASPLGIDKEWPAKFLIPLMDKCPGMKPVLASDCVDRCRAVKDSEEIKLMKEASRINDLVIQRAAEFIRPGMTEKEVAEFIDREYLKEGCEGTSFTTIVSFGEHAADPHHVPDDTVVKEEDCVLIDMGCRKDRYCSDMTRTFFLRSVDEECAKIHDIVREANERAESMIKPGVVLKDVDAAARDFITAAGYGPNFNHRLGHFIGQIDHEKGDVSSVSEIIAEPGMIFSIEPGIYIEGKYGVRVEDLVLVTEDGVEILNHVDKHYRVIG